ncbi:MAG: type I 3-dehydroquinate dehydratase [Verrucomicrobium sp.]|nr:type I 3-dehydroquinate dehydratase [Verrucomicrobium sp.]
MKPLDFSAPRVVGTVVTGAGLAKLARPPQGIGLVEVRADALLQDGLLLAEILHALRRRKVPVLLTCRIPEEGGLYAWERGERKETLRHLLPHAEAFDLELASLPSLKAEAAAARQAGKKLVLSVHSLAEAPSPAALRRWAAALRKARPDVAKIAAKAETAAHLRALARLFLEESERPGPAWAVMGTGPQAAASRIALGALGTALRYGYLDKPAAPNQPSAASLVD